MHSLKNKWVRSIVVSLVAAALLVLGTAYALRKRPVLLHVMAESGCACGEYHEEITGIILRNPFRDVSPERVGTRFLEDLRNDRCDVSSLICGYALPNHRISDWQLVNRHDTSDHTQLFYRLTKYGESDHKHKLTGEGLIEVAPRNGAWVVTNYSSYF